MLGHGVHLGAQPGRIDQPEQRTDREQPLLLEILDERADLSGDPDRSGGIGGPAGLGDPFEDHRYGQADDGQQRNGDENGELGPDPQPTEQHGPAPVPIRRIPSWRASR